MMRMLAAALLVFALPLDARADVRTNFDAFVGEARATMQTDPQRTYDKAIEAEAFGKAIEDARQRKLAVALTRWLQGEALYRMDRPDRAEPLVDEAFTVTRALDPVSKQLGDILLTRGSIQASQGKVAPAFDAYQSAYRIFYHIGDRRSQAITLLCVASLYAGANDYTSVSKYLARALDIYRGDPSLLIAIYNNRASNYMEMGLFSQAENEYSQALNLAKQMNSELLRARILGNIATARLRAGDVSGASRYVNDAVRLVRNGEAAAWRLPLDAISAQVSYQENDLTRAAQLIGERFAGVDLGSTTMSFRGAHETAYKIYHALGEDRLALAHLSAMKRLDDDAAKLATQSSTALMAARFDFANQELKIAQLKAEDLRRSIDFERGRARFQRYIFVGAALATVAIIALLGFALFTSRRARARVDAANADLAVTNAALGKALTAKTEFLATTSHEIRTPLNGILGMTQVMLADQTLAPDLRDRLGIVHGAGVTMRALVDDILDVAKMETGNLTIESAPFDLRATIADASAMWEIQARAKGVAFGRSLDGCPGLIEGDAARVRQIVFNLASNALKFTEAGAVTLSARETGDGHYVIVVRDTGIGIPADKLEAIFESFRQADAGTTRQFGGTGLGLAICRNLARAMQGDVTVESVPGQGSAFTVTLPLIPAEAPPVGAVADAGDTPGLMVLDRNPITRSMFRTLLTPHLGTILFASTVEEAIGHMRAGAVDRLLIDEATIGDGDMTTLLTAIAVAARGVGAETMMLCRASSDAVLDAGIDRIITKPINGAALIAALTKKDDNAHPGSPGVPRAA